MRTNSYAVFDSKAKFFGNPFFVQNDALALRAFAEATNDPQTQLYKNPEDFTLFNIGTYDDETAVLTASNPINLGIAAQYKGV